MVAAGLRLQTLALEDTRAEGKRIRMEADDLTLCKKVLDGWASSMLHCDASRRYALTEIRREREAARQKVRFMHQQRVISSAQRRGRMSLIMTDASVLIRHAIA